MVNQAAVIPASTAACPRVSQKCDFPVPEDPTTLRFSRRPTHSGVRSAVWVGTGIEEASSFRIWKVLPVGKAARVRRVRRLAASRPAASSARSARTTSAGSHRWAFAVGMTSAIARRMCGSFKRRVRAIASSNAAPVVAATAEAGAASLGRAGAVAVSVIKRSFGAVG